MGHVSTAEGVRSDPGKIDTILKLRIPTTIKGIKSFLGFTGYYRKFIRDFSKVAYPMIKYLKLGSVLNVDDPNYINSFEKLKRIITEAPVLRYPDFRKPFQLITDTSLNSLGAVLRDNRHPICFASRTLNEHEVNYSATEKELLAIIWPTSYFRPYLYGAKFEILSDHQPLKWLFVKLQSRDLNPRLYRWIIKLSDYNLVVNYIKGKDNQVADFLNRINYDSGEINALDNSIQDSLYNNIDDDMATIHCQ